MAAERGYVNVRVFHHDAAVGAGGEVGERPDRLDQIGLHKEKDNSDNSLLPNMTIPPTRMIFRGYRMPPRFQTQPIAAAPRLPPG